MRHPIRTNIRFLILSALLSGSVGCTDTPFTPQELSAAQISQLEQMLGTLSTKLDAIDSKIDEQTLALEARIDSLEAALAASGTGGGGTTPASGLLDSIWARSDSIMALSSYIAEDISTAAFEICGGLELGGEVKYGGGAEADGRAAGDLGAWAGTGAFAGVIAWVRTNLEGEIKAAVPFGIEGCVPLGVGDPPTRPAPAGPMALSPESDALRTTLLDLGSQFNLDPNTLPQTLSNIAGTIQSPGSLTLQDIGNQMPLPAAFANIANDPVGTVTGRFQSLSDDALDLLCGGASWGTDLSSVISDACALFPGGLPNVAALASISTDFPIIQNTVSAVCTRLDIMGNRSLVIPSYSVNFGNVIGTYTVFPGYNQRLFPSYTSPC